MPIRSLVASAALALAMCIVSPVLADNIFGVPDSYAGLTPDKHSLVDVVELKMKAGIFTYYRLNSVWPQTWQDVVAEGLVTSDLKTPWGEVIDPDDRRLDFAWDIQYEYKQDAPPRLIKFDPNGLRAYRYLDMPSGPTYAEKFAAIQNEQPHLRGKHVLVAKSENHYWLRAFAAASVIREMMVYCWQFQCGGEPLGEWTVFAQSDFFPQSAIAVNPLTGKPWAVDGADNSLSWRDSPAERVVPDLYIHDPETGLRLGASG